MISDLQNKISSRVQVHRMCYLFALSIIAAGIPFSRFLMSLGGVLLVANWVLEGQWRQKREALLHNKPLQIFLLLMVVHVVFLVFTPHFKEGIKDIWIKIPLFYLPVVLAASSSLTSKEVDGLLKIYVIATLVSIFCGWTAYITQHWAEKRLMALYISYARLEINICFAFFVSLYLAYNAKHTCQKIVYGLLSAGMILFLAYSGFLTGLILLIIILVVLSLIYAGGSSNKIFKAAIYTSVILLVSGIGMYFAVITYQYFTSSFNAETAEVYTADGHRYTHRVRPQELENGSYIYTYVCEEELEQAWNKRSHINYKDTVANGFSVPSTLIRYLNSKHLKKDRLGVEALTEQDIRNIENGTANYYYQHSWGLVGRYYSVLWEMNDYYHTGYLAGYSLSQRFELWNASWRVVQQHPLSGVGTGNTRYALSQELIKNNSPIKYSNMKSHNEYLSMLMAFGVVGFMICLIAVFYPVIAKRPRSFVFTVFMIIMLLSMLTEDSLDQQDGATLFAFFYALYVFAAAPRHKQDKCLLT